MKGEKPDRIVRVPTALLDRAMKCIPALQAQPLGAGVRWTEAAVIRLAVTRGMEILERELGLPTPPPPRNLVEERVAEAIKHARQQLSSSKKPAAPAAKKAK